MEKKLAVIAIGGNALNKPGEKATSENMFNNLDHSIPFLAQMLKEDYDVVITHGNGPQVGNILIQQEMAKEKIPPFPIDINDAQTQGSLGYMIAQSLHNHLQRIGHPRPICPVVTQIIVDEKDPAFTHPTKPVGPFYTETESKALEDQMGWIMVEDSGRGYRRVVPSPIPLDIIEKEGILHLIQADVVVIAAGGGGIPVRRDEKGHLHGVEAVIDKDRASALLALEIEADELIILTGVEKVCTRFGKPDQEALDSLTVSRANALLAKGEFPKGSMGPKIQAAVSYVEKSGKDCLITSIERLQEGLEGKTGTRIIPG